MEKIKLKIFAVISFLLLQDAALAVHTLDDIYQAIQSAQSAIVNALSGTSNSSLVNALNQVFVGKIGDSSTDNRVATIDQKIDMYAQNFYSFYANNLKFGNPADGKFYDLLGYRSTVENNLEYLLENTLSYGADKLQQDNFKLFMQQAEPAGNNFGENGYDRYNAYYVNDDAILLKYMANLTSGAMLGSLTSEQPTTTNSQNTTSNSPFSITPTPLDVENLIGFDGYSDTTAENNAKLFLRYLLASIKPPKGFFITPKTAGVDPLPIYLPSKEVQGANPRPTQATASVAVADYDKMWAFLGSMPLFQDFKLAYRGKKAAIAAFQYALLNMYQERRRTFANQNDKSKMESLTEIEKNMATEGLQQSYYFGDNTVKPPIVGLNQKTAAEVNLELLRTINKVVYFLYKLHQDNEQMKLMTAMSGLIQLQSGSASDDQIFIQPLTNVFKNQCWQFLGMSADDLNDLKKDKKRYGIYNSCKTLLGSQSELSLSPNTSAMSGQ